MQREKQPELFKKAGNQKDEEEDYFLRACLFKSKIDEAHCDGQIERKGKNGGNRAPEPVGEESMCPVTAEMMKKAVQKMPKTMENEKNTINRMFRVLSVMA